MAFYDPWTQTGFPPNSMPGVPQQGFPQNSMPGVPQQGFPPTSMPGFPQPPGMTAPQQGFPPMPQQGVPQQGFPQMPQQGFPPMPQQGFQHQGVPQQGFPPMPQQGFPNAMPGFPQPPGMAAPQQRLDPNAMPSFVQVLEDDRGVNANRFFNTGYLTAEQPPLVTTEFVANDTGNSNPKFIRSSVYQVPSNGDMIKKAQFPFTLAVTPFAELDPREIQPPVVDFGEMGPIRCQRCRAYISPFFEFVDGGQSYRCPFCQATTPVHQTYFAHLDCNARRIDIDYRPELRFGSYEFVATKQYCENNILPNEPAFVFLIDVSYQSVSSGLVDLLCKNLPDLLENLPKEFNAPKSSIKIALATYDQTIHFYDLDSNARPRMCILSDVNEVFVPFVQGLFVDFEVAKENLQKCLADITATFSGTRVTETILGPAISVGLKALSSANRNGKLFVFHTNLPTFEAPGRLKNREDRKLLGTDKEKTVLTEATDYYKKLGKECVTSGVCVDVFLFPNAHVDIASIAPVSHLSGGAIYKYQYFDSQKDGKRFLAELQRDISRPIGFDVKVRVRTSMGIRPTGFYGSFYMDNVTDMQIGALDCDKSMQLEIKYDDKLNDQDRAYVQVATLFTSCGGQRRLRIHNIALAITSDYNTMYRAADQNSVFVYLFKHAEWTLREKTPKEMRDDIVNRCAQILAAYREKCSENSPIGQLILPEGLKLLPLIGNCIVKSEALSGGAEITVDDRAWMMSIIPSLRVDEAMRLLYPTVLPITSLALESPDQQLELPSPVRASVEFLQQSEAYIIENGILCFVWVGSAVSPEWIQDVFDARALDRLDTESVSKGTIPERDNVHSRAVRQVLSRLNEGRSRQLKLFIVKPGDSLESWMKKFLVEDRYGQGAESYVDFLCNVHREIRSLLS